MDLFKTKLDEQITQLQTRNDELEAQVERLRKAVKAGYEPHMNYIHELDCTSEELLNETPAKSLNEIRAKAVEEFLKKQLRTYLVLSRTNYGETVTVINAKGEDDMKEIARDCDTVWDGYTFIEVDISIRGQLGCYGGE